MIHNKAQILVCQIKSFVDGAADCFEKKTDLKLFTVKSIVADFLKMFLRIRMHIVQNKVQTLNVL